VQALPAFLLNTSFQRCVWHLRPKAASAKRVAGRPAPSRSIGSKTRSCVSAGDGSKPDECFAFALR
jgi:hypothetical protein